MDRHLDTKEEWDVWLAALARAPRGRFQLAARANLIAERLLVERYPGNVALEAIRRALQAEQAIADALATKRRTTQRGAAMLFLRSALATMFDGLWLRSAAVALLGAGMLSFWPVGAAEPPHQVLRLAPVDVPADVEEIAIGKIEPVGGQTSSRPASAAAKPPRRVRPAATRQDQGTATPKLEEMRDECGPDVPACQLALVNGPDVWSPEEWDVEIGDEDTGPKAPKGWGKNDKIAARAFWTRQAPLPETRDPKPAPNDQTDAQEGAGP